MEQVESSKQKVQLANFNQTNVIHDCREEVQLFCEQFQVGDQGDHVAR